MAVVVVSSAPRLGWREFGEEEESFPCRVSNRGRFSLYLLAIQFNLGSRTNFPSKTSRMTNGVSDYEHTGWQQWQAESIGAGVSVAG
jgi:hypothetical protein